MIAYVRWRRAQRRIEAYGPIDLAMRHPRPSWAFIWLSGAFYLLWAALFLLQFPLLGIPVALVIVLLEVRTVLFHRLEGIELRGRELVLHENGVIRAFDRGRVRSFEVYEGNGGCLSWPRHPTTVSMVKDDGGKQIIWGAMVTEQNRRAADRLRQTLDRWLKEHPIDEPDP